MLTNEFDVFQAAWKLLLVPNQYEMVLICWFHISNLNMFRDVFDAFQVA